MSRAKKTLDLWPIRGYIVVVRLTNNPTATREMKMRSVCVFFFIITLSWAMLCAATSNYEIAVGFMVFALIFLVAAIKKDW